MNKIDKCGGKVRIMFHTVEILHWGNLITNVSGPIFSIGMYGRIPDTLIENRQRSARIQEEGTMFTIEETWCQNVSLNLWELGSQIYQMCHTWVTCGNNVFSWKLFFVKINISCDHNIIFWDGLFCCSKTYCIQRRSQQLYIIQTALFRATNIFQKESILLYISFCLFLSFFGSKSALVLVLGIKLGNLRYLFTCFTLLPV